MEEEEVRVSEEDTDSSLCTIKKNEKTKLKGKIPEGEAIFCKVMNDRIPSVPRRARTGTRKRRQETEHSRMFKQQSPLSPNPVVSSSITAWSSPLKLVKVTAISNSIKPRASKLAKLSSSSCVSQQEVEVAEALFNLARMRSGFESPHSDSRVKIKQENVETNIQSASCNFPSLSPVHISVSAASYLPSSRLLYVSESEVPIRKSHRIEGELMTPLPPRNDSEGSLVGVQGEVNDHALKSREINKPLVEDEVKLTMEDGNALIHHGGIDLSVSRDPTLIKQHANMDSISAGMKRSLEKISSPIIPIEIGKSGEIGVQDKRGDHPGQCDAISSATASSCKLGDQSSQNSLKLNETDLVKAQKLRETSGNTMGVEEKRFEVQGGERISKCIGASTKKEIKEERMNAINKTELPKNNVLKQLFATNYKLDKPQQGNDTSTAAVLPLGHRGFPDMKYFSTMAANGTTVVGSLLPEDKNHVLKVAGSRQPCKRCFIHVYLARFINTQQTIQQNPLRAEPNMNMRARSFDFRHYNLKGSHPGKMVCAPSSMSGLTSFSGSKSPGSRSSRPVLGCQNQESQTIVSQEKGLIPIVSSPHNEQILHIETGLRRTKARSDNMLVSSAVSDSQSINVLHTHMSYLQASCQHAGTPLLFPDGHFESPQKLSSQKNQQQPQPSSATKQKGSKLSPLQNWTGSSMTQQQQNFFSPALYSQSPHGSQRNSREREENNIGGQSASSAESKQMTAVEQYMCSDGISNIQISSHSHYTVFTAQSDDEKVNVNQQQQSALPALSLQQRKNSSQQLGPYDKSDETALHLDETIRELQASQALSGKSALCSSRGSPQSHNGLSTYAVGSLNVRSSKKRSQQQSYNKDMVIQNKVFVAKLPSNLEGTRFSYGIDQGKADVAAVGLSRMNKVSDTNTTRKMKQNSKTSKVINEKNTDVFSGVASLPQGNPSASLQFLGLSHGNLSFISSIAATSPRIGGITMPSECKYNNMSIAHQGQAQGSNNDGAKQSLVAKNHYEVQEKTSENLVGPSTMSHSIYTESRGPVTVPKHQDYSAKKQDAFSQQKHLPTVSRAASFRHSSSLKSGTNSVSKNLPSAANMTQKQVTTAPFSGPTTQVLGSSIRVTVGGFQPQQSRQQNNIYDMKQQQNIKSVKHSVVQTYPPQDKAPKDSSKPQNPRVQSQEDYIYMQPQFYHHQQFQYPVSRQTSLQYMKGSYDNHLSSQQYPHSSQVDSSNQQVSLCINQTQISMKSNGLINSSKALNGAIDIHAHPPHTNVGCLPYVYSVGFSHSTGNYCPSGVFVTNAKAQSSLEKDHVFHQNGTNSGFQSPLLTTCQAGEASKATVVNTVSSNGSAIPVGLNFAIA